MNIKSFFSKLSTDLALFANGDAKLEAEVKKIVVPEKEYTNTYAIESIEPPEVSVSGHYEIKSWDMGGYIVGVFGKNLVISRVDQVTGWKLWTKRFLAGSGWVYMTSPRDPFKLQLEFHRANIEKALDFFRKNDKLIKKYGQR